MAEEIKALVLLIRKIHLMLEARKWERTARKLMFEYPHLAPVAMAKAEELTAQI